MSVAHLSMNVLLMVGKEGNVAGIGDLGLAVGQGLGEIGQLFRAV